MTGYEIERFFDVPASRMYEAWTKPQVMRQWMWASLGRDAWAECDARVGGTYRVYTKLAGGSHQGEGWSGMCGLYVALEPDRRIVMTLHWDADVGYNTPDRLSLDEIMIITLAREGSGTRLRFSHLGIPDDGVSAPTHRAGVEQSFDMLEEILGPPDPPGDDPSSDDPSGDEAAP